MAQKDANERKVLEALAKIAGETFTEDDIVYEGSRLVIPASMTATAAVKTLNRHIEAMEEVNAFTRTYQFRPWDGASAVVRALKKVTGSVIPTATYSFFGKEPPRMISIPTGPGETEQVPWGAINIPLFDGTAYLSAVVDEELGQLFTITIEAPRKHRGPVEGFFMAIDEELRTNSIYRGKAFNGKELPEFLDLTGVDPDKVVYSADVYQQLDANIWAQLEHTSAMRANEIPLKRAVLVHGDYGTGKTLAAYLTAQRAVANGWTFIYCRPSKDDLFDTMATARLYAPAVVFFEDVDVVSDPDSGRDKVAELLDIFDGISSKGNEVMVVLTTNHPEKIHKGMVRPGRLDAVIEIGHLDPPGIEKLIGQLVEPEMLASDIHYASVLDAMEGFSPAFVRETIDRAKRYALTRNDGQLESLTTADFIAAANGLRPQLELMEDAPEHDRRDTLGIAMERVMTAAVAEAVDDAEIFRGEDKFGDIRFPELEDAS